MTTLTASEARANLYRLIECGDADIANVKSEIEKHVELTGSPRGKHLLANWDAELPKFFKVFPRDYERMLECFRKVEEQGLSGDEAAMAAFGQLLFQIRQRLWLLAWAIEDQALIAYRDIPVRFVAAGTQEGAGEVDVCAAMAFSLYAVHLARHELAIDTFLRIGLQLAAHIDIQRGVAVSEQRAGIAAQLGGAVFLEDKLTLFLAGAKQQLARVQAELALHARLLDHRLGGFIGKHLAAGEQWQQGKAKRAAETHRGTPEKCAHVT